MYRLQKALGVLLLLSAGNALAQTATNTFPASGNVGFGTTTPGTALQVIGTVEGDSTNQWGAHFGVASASTDVTSDQGMPLVLQNNSATSGNYSSITFFDANWNLQGSMGLLYGAHTGMNQGTFYIEPRIVSTPSAFVVAPNGNVGINTTSPLNQFDVEGYVNGVYVSNPGIRLSQSGSHDLVMNYGYDSASSTDAFTLTNYAKSASTGGNNLLTILSAGNVGIGTTNPQAKLDVNGGINISGAGAGITFPNNGGTQTVAWTGTTCGGDYAESVDVSGDRTHYEPGDVLVIGAEIGSDVVKSSEPYSTLVAGIYSTKPGIVGRRQTVDAKTSSTEVPMAMVGIVPTKASAENGTIKRGDLLVSSSTVGYAMKGTDRSRMLGAVIGKAMGNLDNGTGVIEVLVTLQ